MGTVDTVIRNCHIDQRDLLSAWSQMSTTDELATTVTTPSSALRVAHNALGRMILNHKCPFPTTIRGSFTEEIFVATYSCPTCGMAVNASCAKCNVPLVNGTLTKDDGSTVQVSWCPSDDSCGKIKSPMCCGADMACSVA